MCQKSLPRWRGTKKTKTKKQSEDNIIKHVRNLFRPEKETEASKTIVRDNIKRF